MSGPVQFRNSEIALYRIVFVHRYLKQYKTCSLRVSYKIKTYHYDE